MECHNISFENKASAEAALGHLSCLKELSSKVKFTKEDAISAISAGNMECFLYLLEQGAPISDEYTFIASSYGQLDILKFLVKRDFPIHSESAQAACRYDNHECLEYLHENGAPVDIFATNEALRLGRLNCLKYLDSKNIPIDQLSIDYAIENEKFDALDYLFYKSPNRRKHNKNLILDKLGDKYKEMAKFEIMAKHNIRFAIKLNRFDLIEKCISKGASLNINLADIAIKHGSLESLICLVEHGCPIDESSINTAILEDQLSSLIYLVEKGCDWGSPSVELALENGAIDSFLYLMSIFLNYNGFHEAIDLPLDPDNHDFRPEVQQLFGLEHFRISVPNGICNEDVVYISDFWCCCEIFQSDKTNKELAIMNGHLDCLRYLFRRKSDPEDFEDILFFTTYIGNLECLKFMFDIIDRDFDPNDNYDFFQYIKRGDILEYIIEKCHVDCLLFILEKQNYTNLPGMANESIYHGHLECLKIFVDRGFKVDETSMISASQSGYIDIIQYLVYIGCPWSTKCIKYAKNIDVVKFFVQAGCPFDKDCVTTAVKKKKLDVVKYLIDMNCPIDLNDCIYSTDTEECLDYIKAYLGMSTLNVFEYKQERFFQDLQKQKDFCCRNFVQAAQNGYTESLRFLIERNNKSLPYASDKAVKNNHLECLELLFDHGRGVDDNTCFIAAQGNLDCLKFLIENGCPITEGVAYYAAGGHLECLKYLGSKGFQFSVMATNNAAKGHLDCLIYLVERGSPMNCRTTKSAAKFSLECLKYLIENGCPFDAEALDATVSIGHIDIVKYLIEKGCPMNQNLLESALFNGQLECLSFLIENGCPWKDRVFNYLEESVRPGNVDCVKYMIDKIRESNLKPTEQ